MIAEDDEYNYLYLYNLLEKEKIKIKRALNGKEAVDICLNEKIDLVLMDIKMPVKNGIEATKEILRHKPHLPVIMQTAFAYPEDKEKSLCAGCVEYITKPISPELIVEVIGKWLKK